MVCPIEDARVFYCESQWRSEAVYASDKTQQKTMMRDAPYFGHSRAFGRDNNSAKRRGGMHHENKDAESKRAAYL